METIVTVKESASKTEVSGIDEPDSGLVIVPSTGIKDVEKLSRDALTSVETISPAVCIGKVVSCGNTVGVTEVRSDATIVWVGSTCVELLTGMDSAGEELSSIDEPVSVAKLLATGTDVKPGLDVTASEMKMTEELSMVGVVIKEDISIEPVDWD